MPKGCSNPGHGGKDPGALGSKSLEKNINLQVSLKFAQRMRQQGFEMIETRTSDTFISLSDICAIANRNSCDFFQSNHCNAGHGHGFEIYALPGGRAVKYAQVMERYLAKALGIPDRGVKTNQNFYVLVHTDMPSILIELAFIDNPTDEALLLNNQWQEKAVEAMVQAWCEIYGVTYRPVNQPQQPAKPPAKPPVSTTPQPKPVEEGSRSALVEQAMQQISSLSEIIKKLGQ